MTTDKQIERALDEVMEAVEVHADAAHVSEDALRAALREALCLVIARAADEAREAEDEKRGVENFDGPGRW